MSDSSFWKTLFDQLREWLSFFDSVWGVGSAVVVTAVVMSRRARRDRTAASGQIRALHTQIGEVSRIVETLEAENARLAEQIAQFSQRDLQQVVIAARQANPIADRQSVAENLSTCVSLNATYLAEAALSLSRIHLDAFYTNGDTAQLNEAGRFALLASVATPDALDAMKARAEIMAAIAANPGANASLRERDELWDEAFELLGHSSPTASGPEKFIALQQLGTQLRNEGKYELAGAALRGSYRIATEIFGENSPETLAALNNVATNFGDRGLPDQAKTLFKELAERQQNAAGHIDEQTYRYLIAEAACERQIDGESAALSRMESLLKDGRERFGENNRWVLKAQNSLAVCLAAARRDSEAEALYRDAIEKETRLFGHDHVNPLATRANLAALLFRTNRKEEAIAVMMDVARRRAELHGEAHPETVGARHALERMRTEAQTA